MQDRSLDLLTSSPACYHRTTDISSLVATANYCTKIALRSAYIVHPLCSNTPCILIPMASEVSHGVDFIYLFVYTLNSVTFDYYAERQCGVRSLPRAPTNGHCWKLNPRPFDQSDWVGRFYQLGHSRPIDIISGASQLGYNCHTKLRPLWTRISIYIDSWDKNWCFQHDMAWYILTI